MSWPQAIVEIVRIVGGVLIVGRATANSAGANLSHFEIRKAFHRPSWLERLRQAIAR